MMEQPYSDLEAIMILPGAHALLSWDYKRGGDYNTDTQLLYRHPTTIQAPNYYTDTQLISPNSGIILD